MKHIENILKAEGIDYEIVEENMGLLGNSADWTKTHIIKGSIFTIHPELNLIEIDSLNEKSLEKDLIIKEEGNPFQSGKVKKKKVLVIYQRIYKYYLQSYIFNLF